MVNRIEFCDDKSFQIEKAGVKKSSGVFDIEQLIIINGSPRKVSNTKYVADVIKDIIIEKHMDMEYTDLFLKDAIFSMCCGCRACFVNGELYCQHKDDALQIKEKNIDL